MATHNPLRLGVIGSGWFASRRHCPDIVAHDEATLTALCRRSRPELERMGQAFEVNALFTDYGDLLTSGLVDGVVICSPHDLHYEHARAALENHRSRAGTRVGGTGRTERPRPPRGAEPAVLESLPPPATDHRRRPHRIARGGVDLLGGQRPRRAGPGAAAPRPARCRTAADVRAVLSLRLDDVATATLSNTADSQVRGGTADNIIPGQVQLSGTVRTLNSETRRLTFERIERVAAETARAYGASAEVTIDDGYPVLENDPAATDYVRRVAGSTIGTIPVDINPVMGGEDFAFYAQRVPASFFTLGMLHPGHAPRRTSHVPNVTLHQPDYDFSDDAIPLGVAMHVEIARRFWREGPQAA